MSYLVFARKWRPLKFSDVLGQEHITATLQRAIEKNRVAHAYIFSGTRGVGKTTTARILARALNCEKGPTPEPCGNCEYCISILNGSSFDVIEIDGASNNGVDNIRELRENITYTSMSGKFRIFVIDEVHMLTKGAFNALLKTLEEPPPKVIFIFATTEPQKIPDTIQSRCQRFDFRRISVECILTQLEKICKKETISIEKEALYLIAQRGDGSMRDSLSLLDQVYSFCSDHISENQTRIVLGILPNDVYHTLITSFIEKQPAAILETIDSILIQGYDLTEFIIGFEQYLRILLFAKIPEWIKQKEKDYSSMFLQTIARNTASFSEGDLLRYIEITRKLESDIRWSALPRFLVETALLKMLYMDKTISLNSILHTLKSAVSENSSLSTQIEKKKKLI